MSGPMPQALAAAANAHAAAALHPMGRHAARFDHVLGDLRKRVAEREHEDNAAAKTWGRMSPNVRLLLAITVTMGEADTAQAIALSRWADMPQDMRAALATNARVLQRETAQAHLLHA